tara:strand:- start:292 stop:1002 length:711 start_codon:yes stop_codon:yes gene_type:complete
MNKSILIPVFNEQGNIGNLITKIKKKLDLEDEIIIIDDGSTDKTQQEAEEQKCKVLKHDKNLGKGAAMRTGIKNAKGQLIIFMGGDGQDDPEEIDLLINGVVEGYDYVIGSRFVKDNSLKERYSNKAILPINKIGNKSLTFLINILFGQSITDSQSEFKCFKADKLKELNLESNRYEIETELLIKSFRNKLKIKEVPVHRYERIHGKSYLFDVPFGRFIFGMKVLKTIIKGYFFWK